MALAKPGRIAEHHCGCGWFQRGLRRGGRLWLLLLCFVFADDVDQFAVTAFRGHDDGLGIWPVRPDSAVRIRAPFQQEAHHGGVAAQHRGV
jgi:hypothetical protein